MIGADGKTHEKIQLIPGGRRRLDKPNGMEAAVWDRISGLGRVVRLSPKQLLYEEGDGVKSGSIVLSGLLLIRTAQTVLDFAEAGQSVGMALIDLSGGSSAYPVSVEAMGPAAVLEISQSELPAVLLEPMVFEYTQQQVKLRTLFMQGCRARQSLTVQGRLAYAMLQKQSALSSGFITRRILAQLVGTSTESVIRILSAWEKNGTIASQNRRITILDLNHMENLCQLAVK